MVRTWEILSHEVVSLAARHSYARRRARERAGLGANAGATSHEGGQKLAVLRARPSLLGNRYCPGLGHACCPPAHAHQRALAGPGAGGSRASGLRHCPTLPVSEQDAPKGHYGSTK
jgi:hypothetical protein